MNEKAGIRFMTWLPTPNEKTDLATAKPALVQELAKRLQTWRTLQIEYYADKPLQAREYPPILAD